MNAASPITPAARALSLQALGDLPAPVVRPGYDPRSIKIGVVHLGPGAFHRAHQAWYLDDLLSQDPRWGISAVSLNSRTVRDALQPQDLLYTVSIRDQRPLLRVIGALRECLVAPDSPQRVLQRMTAADTHIVTLTITEKGYCLDAQGLLDLNLPGIVHDLAQPGQPRTAIGYLAEALRQRRRSGLKPLTVISCDNLSDNGDKLARAVRTLLERTDPDSARWLDDHGAFPCTMVDSIVPATDDTLRDSVRSGLGVEDAWPVQREAFSQWVIADRFAGERPDLGTVGATLTDDVAAFESAKLRLLNGAHSSLAYLGLLRGHASVRDAMDDAELASFVRELMVQDIQPQVRCPRGLDLPAYIDSVLERFRNPAIRHELAQIAWDGSQKLPVRLFGTVIDALAKGRPIDRLCSPIAAWLLFIRRAALDGRPITDPLADSLLALGRATSGHAVNDVAMFLREIPVFPLSLVADARFAPALTKAYEALSRPA